MSKLPQLCLVSGVLLSGETIGMLVLQLAATIADVAAASTTEISLGILGPRRKLPVSDLRIWRIYIEPGPCSDTIRNMCHFMTPRNMDGRTGVILTHISLNSNIPYPTCEQPVVLEAKRFRVNSISCRNSIRLRFRASLELLV